MGQFSFEPHQGRTRPMIAKVFRAIGIVFSDPDAAQNVPDEEK
jgi:hypothetical protein